VNSSPASSVIAAAEGRIRRVTRTLTAPRSSSSGHGPIPNICRSGGDRQASPRLCRKSTSNRAAFDATSCTDQTASITTTKSSTGKSSAPKSWSTRTAGATTTKPAPSTSPSPSPSRKAGTVLQMTTVFGSAADLEQAVRKYGAIEGATSTLARLETHLSAM